MISVIVTLPFGFYKSIPNSFVKNPNSCFGSQLITLIITYLFSQFICYIIIQIIDLVYNAFDFNGFNENRNFI